jgi:hypothetical protein
VVFVVLTSLFSAGGQAVAGDALATGSSTRHTSTARWRTAWSTNVSTQDATVDHASVFDVEDQPGTARCGDRRPSFRDRHGDVAADRCSQYL